MAGFSTSLVNNIYPAEFGQISRNITNLQADASQHFAVDKFQSGRLAKHTQVNGEDLKTEADRDGDGHDWGAPERRRREPAPEPHELELLAGEGALFDSRA